MNSVDVIYAASPIYLYLNSSILGYLLRPLLEYQESGLYPNAFAAVDIGKRATNSARSMIDFHQVRTILWRREITSDTMKVSNVSDLRRPLTILSQVQISESGNMLIMTYAHAQRSGDTSLLFQHVRLQSYLPSTILTLWLAIV